MTFDADSLYLFKYAARKVSWNIESVEPSDQEGPG